MNSSNILGIASASVIVIASILIAPSATASDNFSANVISSPNQFFSNSGRIAANDKSSVGKIFSGFRSRTNMPSHQPVVNQLVDANRIAVTANNAIHAANWELGTYAIRNTSQASSGGSAKSTVRSSKTHSPSAVIGTGTPTAVIGTGTPNAVIGTGSPNAVIGTGSPDAVIGTGSPNAVIGTGASKAAFGVGYSPFSGSFGTDAVIGTGQSNNAVIGTGQSTNAVIGTGQSTNAVIGTGLE